MRDFKRWIYYQIKRIHTNVLEFSTFMKKHYKTNCQFQYTQTKWFSIKRKLQIFKLYLIGKVLFEVHFSGSVDKLLFSGGMGIKIDPYINISSSFERQSHYVLIFMWKNLRNNSVRAKAMLFGDKQHFPLQKNTLWLSQPNDTHHFQFPCKCFHFI